MERSPHILNAASNLLGISLLIITGLHVTGTGSKSFADEIAWVAAALFGLSCLCSYLALHNHPAQRRIEAWSDWAFFIGMLTLFGAVLLLAITKLF